MEFTCESNSWRVSETKSKKEKNKHIHVLHKVFYCENSKMRFFWHCHSGKMDCISQSQHA